MHSRTAILAGVLVLTCTSGGRGARGGARPLGGGQLDAESSSAAGRDAPQRVSADALHLPALSFEDADLVSILEVLCLRAGVGLIVEDIALGDDGQLEGLHGAFHMPQEGMSLSAALNRLCDLFPGFGWRQHSGVVLAYSKRLAQLRPNPLSQAVGPLEVKGTVMDVLGDLVFSVPGNRGCRVTYIPAAEVELVPPLTLALEREVIMETVLARLLTEHGLACHPTVSVSARPPHRFHRITFVIQTADRPRRLLCSPPPQPAATSDDTARHSGQTIFVLIGAIALVSAAAFGFTWLLRRRRRAGPRAPS